RGVGGGARPGEGQVPPVAQPAIAPQIDQPLDVRRHVAAEIALDLVRGVDLAPDAGDLVVGQVVALAAGIDLRHLADALGRRPPDAIDVGECDLHALVARQIDACDACHAAPVLPIPGAACAGGWSTGRGPRPRAGSPYISCRSAVLMLVPSYRHTLAGMPIQGLLKI